MATGMVLSQFWPGSSPTKQSFPMRNATMSAYGEATVIVEAGEHSGARIQARLALAHGRPLILREQVAAQTTWGAELSRSAGDVHVVSGVDEALAVVGKIMNRDQELRALRAVLA